MQTFMPHTEFNRIARSLDTVRLNKQITECGQMLSALFGDSRGYANHPATQAWQGYESGLYCYAAAMANQWFTRTRKSSHGGWSNCANYACMFDGTHRVPWWIGCTSFHETHQSRLIHKGDVDILRRRFGKSGREQKQSWLSFREANKKNKEWPINWYELTHKHLLDIVWYMRGLDTSSNPYRKLWPNVRPDLAYLWPVNESKTFKFKTTQRGKWQPWKLGDPVPVIE